MNRLLSITLAAALTAGASLAAAPLMQGTPVPGGSEAPVRGNAIGQRLLFNAPAKAPSDAPRTRLGERNPLVPPFCEIFEDFPDAHNTFDARFQRIDANNDERCWGFYNYHDESRGYSMCAYLLYPIDTPAADDWLIPRAIRLEEGKYYYIYMDASLFTDGGDHTFDVWMGHYNDVAGMEYRVIPTVHVSSHERTRVGGWFRAPEDGTYYMGIHATTARSPQNVGYLFIDNIGMEAAKLGGEPSTVTDLSFVNDPTGAPAVTLNFRAPAKSISGAPLSGNIDLRILRDSKQIANLTGITPGQNISYTDANAGDPGNHTYRIEPSNAVGTGEALQVLHYVGLQAPLAPVITDFEETENGSVMLMWNPVTADVAGNAIDPSMVTYTIWDYILGAFEPVLSTEENSVEMPLNLRPNEQRALNLYLTASMGDKVSAMSTTDVIFAGTPYQLPYVNSFTENETGETVLAAGGDPSLEWRLLDDFSDPMSQDGDNGYVCMIGTQPNLKGFISTGKITLPPDTPASVSFYAYIYPQSENTIELSVVDIDSGETTVIGTIDFLQFSRVGWNRIAFSLAEFAGHTVRIVISPKIVTDGYVPLDNLRIEAMSPVDLAVDIVDYSTAAEGGENYDVTARISNMGALTASAYKVNLLCDGRIVASVDGPELQSFEHANVVLSGTFSPADSTMPTFEVEAEIDGDGNPVNNVSDPFNIAFIASVNPKATNLTIEEKGDKIALAWTAPDLSMAPPAPSLEDFESYAPFTTSLRDGWTMIDGDGGYICGFNGITMPVDMTKQAWWTMSDAEPYSFIPTIGHVSLAQMASVDDNRRPVVNDDWLVSPELYGGAQTIAFYAISVNDSYGNDCFEVYYSTGGNTIKDMRLLMQPTIVPTRWTPFYVSLPEGTRHFAICCTSNDCYMMLLDEITYIAPGEPRDLYLRGYNIYRNDTLLNSEPVPDTNYTLDRSNNSDRYYVTAVYTDGESVASNIVSIAGSGIIAIPLNPADATEANDAAAAPVYYDLHGIRVNPDNLAPVLYLRRQGTTVTKHRVP